MSDLETLIYANNIENKLIASDLDGTILWGDLGEAVFFLILAMQASGASLEDVPAFLARLQKNDLIQCGHSPETADIVTRYFGYLQEGKLEEAYSLTANYLSLFDSGDIQNFSRAVLKYGVQKTRLQFQLDDALLEAPIHAMPDPLITRLIKDSFAKGALIRIISGSPQSVVEGYCLFQGLPIQAARGAGKDNDGKMVVPFGCRKVEILKKEGFSQPYIGLGNSAGDYDLLHAAVHSFVRQSSPKEVLEEAKLNHWNLV